MIVLLELRPDQEQGLQETAAAQGLTVEQLVSELIDGEGSKAKLTRRRSILESEGVGADQP